MILARIEGDAKAIQTQVNADDMLELADNANDDSSIAVQKARLQIDTRKWLAMKLLPKIYGENSNTFLLSGNTKVQIDNSILQSIADTVKQGDVTEADVVGESAVKGLISLDKVPPSDQTSPPQLENTRNG